MTRKYGRKKGGGKGTTFAILVLLAAAGGAGFAFRDRITGFVNRSLKPPEKGKRPSPSVLPAVPAPAPPSRPAAPAAPSSPAASPPSSPASAALSSREKDARKRLEAAKEALGKLQFSKAKVLAEQAAALAPSSPTGKEASDLARKAAVFREILRGVRRNPEARRDLTILRMENNSITAVIEEKTPSEYRILMDNGIRAVVPADEVLEEIPVPIEEKKQRLRKELAAYKDRMAPRGPVGLCLAAVFAFRNCLDDQVLPLLEQAFSESDDLLREISDYRAGKMLSLALYWDSIGRSYQAARKLEDLLRKYPESRFVKDARDLLARIKSRKEERVLTFKVKEKTPARNPRPAASRTGASASPPAASGAAATSSPETPEKGEDEIASMDRIEVANPKAKEMIAQADELFARAMKHYLAGRPGLPNHNQELKKAAPLFEKASQLYSDAAELCPGVERLENRASEAARLHYNSLKMQELNMF